MIKVGHFALSGTLFEANNDRHMEYAVLAKWTVEVFLEALYFFPPKSLVAQTYTIKYKKKDLTHSFFLYKNT